MRIFVIGALLFLSACATSASGPVYKRSDIAPVKNGMAQIVVYNASDTIVKNTARIDINGKRRCELNQEGYAVLNVKPGAQDFVVTRQGDWAKSKASFNAKSGQRTYVKIYLNKTPDMGAAFGAIGALMVGDGEYNGPFVIQRVVSDQAETELKGTRRVGGCS